MRELYLTDHKIGLGWRKIGKQEKNALKFNEAQEEMKLRQRSMQYAGNFMNELYVKAKVVDNRYLFF